MRPVLALLGGIAISTTGLGIVLDTTWELGGVALIIAGVAVAVQGMNASTAAGLGAPRGTGGGLARGRSSIVRWPSGLGARLARQDSARHGSARPKAD